MIVGMDISMLCISVVFMHLTIVCTSQHTTTSTRQDGCSSYRYLLDQPGSGSRSASYVSQVKDPLLCDANRGLNGNMWWRFNNSRIPEYSPGYYHCCTFSAIWILGKHPKGYAPTTVEICGTGADNSCSWRRSMQVQRCASTSGKPKKDFFVYQLVDPEECDRAYCVDITCGADERPVSTTVKQCIAKTTNGKIKNGSQKSTILTLNQINTTLKPKYPAVKSTKQQEESENKTKWPELVGKTSDEAVKAIKKERPDLTVQVVPHGGGVTRDYRKDRVRVFIDIQSKKKKVPTATLR